MKTSVDLLPLNPKRETGRGQRRCVIGWAVYSADIHSLNGSVLQPQSRCFKMPQSLRRSCAACAKAKHSCDLRAPRCSRCIKREIQCVYANIPWNVTATPGPDNILAGALDTTSSLSSRIGSIDPFDSYPQTRLPRAQVQRLIHSCKYTFNPCRSN